MRTIIGVTFVMLCLLGSSRGESLVNREPAAVSEVSNVADQEQLRRYFLQGWR